jgi:predicted transposase YbfD/YdcC
MQIYVRRLAMKKYAIASLLAILLVSAVAYTDTLEDCIAFNYKQAKVVNVQGKWKIAVGNMWLKDFGSKKNEAEKALQIIVHYRMNSQCFVGRPDPSLEYYLVDGKAPVGTFPGEDAISFNPDKIEVKQINKSWKIVEGNHWILDFSNKYNEAKTSLAIIKKYRFEYICFVGRPDPSMVYFRKGKEETQPTPPKEDCITFNYKQAKVVNVQGRWKITVGNMWLKDFGNKRDEAEKALQIIVHYRMNSQCFVGRPDPSLEYYLVDGKAPRGPFPGEDAITFNPSKIEVKQINGRWKIVEGTHWILDFANNRDEANEAFGVLRKYQFNRICFVGRPDPSMTYFTRVP